MLRRWNGLPVTRDSARLLRRICPPPSPNDPSISIMLSAAPWVVLDLSALVRTAVGRSEVHTLSGRGREAASGKAANPQAAPSHAGPRPGQLGQQLLQVWQIDRLDQVPVTPGGPRALPVSLLAP